VLITGGSGIAGQNLTRELLKRGADVTTTVHNKGLSNINKDLKTVFCDFMNIDECRKTINDYDIVLNCAAFIRGAKAQAKNNVQLELVRNNIFMALNIITASVENEIPKFGFIGSSTMYPETTYPVEEDEAFDGVPWKGYRGVGWMKRYIEQVCNFYQDISNTKFAIGRTTALYGPYDNFDPELCHVIPATIVKAANKDNPFKIWGDGNEQRNFIYIEDFVDGFLKLVELYAEADPINISSQEISIVNDVVKYSIESANYNPTIEHIDGPKMIPYRVVSTKKAEKILNWKTSTSLKDGIFKTFEWYNNNK